LTQGIAALPQIVSNVLLSRGMILNDKIGKSAIMVTLHGPNSVKAKKTLGQITSVQVNDQHFHITPTYKLVGGMIERDSSNGPELHCRFTDVSAAAVPFRKFVVRKSNLSVRQSVNVTDSLLVSSMLHNSHTWCGISRSEYEKISSRLASLYSASVSDKVTTFNGVTERKTDAYVFRGQERRCTQTNQVKKASFFAKAPQGSF
ncbi:MAG: hypothetical protein GY774_38295, partial [Planctomycetes bacterium]|nr:hypothetical protein [Planctomycetota bacterium]